MATIEVDKDKAIVPEPIEAQHLLVLGDDEFVCADKLPISTLIRYADSSLMQFHGILVKLVDPEDHDRMWDAFEELGDDDAMEAINNLVATYAERPTKSPSRSQVASQRGRRK